MSWLTSVILHNTQKVLGMYQSALSLESQRSFLAHDEFIRMNRRAIAMMFVYLSGTGLHCDHTVHFNVDSSLWWIVQSSEHAHTKVCPPTPTHLSPVPPGRKVEYGCAN